MENDVKVIQETIELLVELVWEINGKNKRLIGKTASVLGKLNEMEAKAKGLM